MNIRGTRTLATAGIAAALALPMQGRAADGTIIFTGAVTENSCTIEVNGAGTGDATIALPVVDTTALDHASTAKQTAAGTFFHITLSNCAAIHPDISGAAPAHVAIYFEAGPGVDHATHGLINAGTSNVEVKLYQASQAVRVGTQITPGTVGAGQPASQAIAGASTQYFYASYSTVAGVAATAGTVSTTVTYSLVYQ